MAIVKISFLWHNRTYTVGIKPFLEQAGIDITDEQITRAVNLILNSQGAPTQEK